MVEMRQARTYLTQCGNNSPAFELDDQEAVLPANGAVLRRGALAQLGRDGAGQLDDHGDEEHRTGPGKPTSWYAAVPSR